MPICVLGDYNQRIPRVSQPQKVSNALLEAIPAQFDIPTKGVLDPDGKSLIDHFAVSPELETGAVKVLHRFALDGTRLSDHVGVLATITTNKTIGIGLSHH